VFPPTAHLSVQISGEKFDALINHIKSPDCGCVALHLSSPSGFYHRLYDRNLNGEGSDYKSDYAVKILLADQFDGVIAGQFSERQRFILERKENFVAGLTGDFSLVGRRRYHNKPEKVLDEPAEVNHLAVHDEPKPSSEALELKLQSMKLTKVEQQLQGISIFLMMLFVVQIIALFYLARR
jgi:hypothetical protein